MGKNNKPVFSILLNEIQEESLQEIMQAHDLKSKSDAIRFAMKEYANSFDPAMSRLKKRITFTIDGYVKARLEDYCKTNDLTMNEVAQQALLDAMDPRSRYDPIDDYYFDNDGALNEERGEER